MGLQRHKIRTLIVLAGLLLAGCLWIGPGGSDATNGSNAYRAAERIGRLEDGQLVECSGMDISPSTPGLFWAINDGHRSPLLFAVGANGRRLGRIWVKGAENRDWEDIDTFRWQGRSMILIADVGDNHRRHDTHTLYVVAEPPFNGEKFEPPGMTRVAWSVSFRYPDTRHDAEAVAVDADNLEVLILTKRDTPPILFKVPLVPPDPDRTVVAEKMATPHLPRPGQIGLLTKYAYQPTAMDISNDGTRAVVLTYTDAYLFRRSRTQSWAEAFGGKPDRIRLPPPLEHLDLRQREAICIAGDNATLYVTSEGRHAGIYRLKVKRPPVGITLFPARLPLPPDEFKAESDRETNRAAITP